MQVQINAGQLYKCNNLNICVVDRYFVIPNCGLATHKTGTCKAINNFPGNR